MALNIWVIVSHHFAAFLVALSYDEQARGQVRCMGGAA
jgi:hypothetical protein